MHPSHVCVLSFSCSGKQGNPRSRRGLPFVPNARASVLVSYRFMLLLRHTRNSVGCIRVPRMLCEYGTVSRTLGTHPRSRPGILHTCSQTSTHPASNKYRTSDLVSRSVRFSFRTSSTNLTNQKPSPALSIFSTSSALIRVTESSPSPCERLPSGCIEPG